MKKNNLIGFIALAVVLAMAACIGIEDIVEKKPGAQVETPTEAWLTHRSIDIDAAEKPANGQSVEYSINDENSVPFAGWQEETSFTGLAPDKYYYIFARSKENNFYLAGAASTPLVRKTRSSPRDVEYTELDYSVWKDGYIPIAGGDQWFSFKQPKEKSQEERQYIHFSPGDQENEGLVNVYVAVYYMVEKGDEITVGSMAGPRVNLSSSNLYTYYSLLNSEETYFLRVFPFLTTSSGNFQIGFNSSFLAPGKAGMELVLNTWEDGEILNAGGEQWFSFKAAATTHFIHFSPRTLTSVNAQVYDSNGTTLGSSASFSGQANISRSVSDGQTYYIKLTPVTPNEKGKFKIGFTESVSLPYNVWRPDKEKSEYKVNVDKLVLNIWEEVKNLNEYGEQWFKFKATVQMQHIHFSPGTLENVYMQIYNERGLIVGNRASLSAGTPSVPRAVNPGDTYYIRVYPITPGENGTFKIGFSQASDDPPKYVWPPDEEDSVNVVKLKLNRWKNGEIPTDGGEQWFSFKASVEEHHIHIHAGTIVRPEIRETYDQYGTKIDDWSSSGSSRNVGDLIIGDIYYIKMYNSSGGTFQISYTETGTSPEFIWPPSAVKLELDKWEDGNISSYDDVCWFEFEAAAATQYMYFTLTTGGSGMTILLYDTKGTNIFGIMGASDPVRFVHILSRTANPSALCIVEEGETYYLKVTPYEGNDFGLPYDFSIILNSPILPSDIYPLEFDVFADGNIPGPTRDQWFSFEATAATFVHFSLLNNNNRVYMALYDDITGSPLISNRSIQGATLSVNCTDYIVAGETYYIRVSPQSGYSYGFDIKFNDSFLPDPSSPLSISTPAETVPVPGRVAIYRSSVATEYFRFTAISTVHQIFLCSRQDSDTLRSINAAVYRSDGTQLGGNHTLTIPNRYAYHETGNPDNYGSSTVYDLTPGVTYYIRVAPGNGTGRFHLSID